MVTAAIIGAAASILALALAIAAADAYTRNNDQ